MPKFISSSSSLGGPLSATASTTGAAPPPPPHCTLLGPLLWNRHNSPSPNHSRYRNYRHTTRIRMGCTIFWQKFQKKIFFSNFKKILSTFKKNFFKISKKIFFCNFSLTDLETKGILLKWVVFKWFVLFGALPSPHRSPSGFPPNRNIQISQKGAKCEAADFSIHLIQLEIRSTLYVRALALCPFSV